MRSDAFNQALGSHIELPRTCFDLSFWPKTRQNRLFYNQNEGPLQLLGMDGSVENMDGRQWKEVMLPT